jgi:hypothetical protein
VFAHVLLLRCWSWCWCWWIQTVSGIRGEIKSPPGAVSGCSGCCGGGRVVGGSRPSLASAERLSTAGRSARVFLSSCVCLASLILARLALQFRAAFEDKILVSDIVFLKAWYAVRSIATSLSLPSLSSPLSLSMSACLCLSLWLHLHLYLFLRSISLFFPLTSNVAVQVKPPRLYNPVTSLLLTNKEVKQKEE